MQSSSLKQQSYPETSLNELELQKLTQAIQGLTHQQLNWSSGYLAGLSHTAHQPAQSKTADLQATILYATHTGNGRGIAEKLADDAAQNGLKTRVLSVSDFKPRDFTKEQLVFLVISTHGEGEPPESAAELHRYLFNERTPQLEQLSFSVLALGDSSYEFFCEAGKQFDDRLEALGANRLSPRIDADVNFQDAAQNWSAEVIQQSQDLLPSHADNVVNLTATSSHKRIDRFNPFEAVLLDSRRITTEQAIANIHHIALEIDPQVISYQPGDALGVCSKNDPALVAEIIEVAGLNADAFISIQGEQVALTQALLEKLELTLLHPTVVANWARVSNSEELLSLTDDARKLREFAQTRQLIDLITEYPAVTDAETLVSLLQPLQPRLYSIASSQANTEDEVHLTVSSVNYDAHGRSHQGTASNHLVERIQQDDLLAVYVAENEHFRLPEDNTKPIIMIGAGTGIAPYRAFLQQREAENAQGENWLVFGNRHFKKDFLYQQDWIQFRKNGVLDRASLAFSRDTTTRAYIQDKLREEGADIYQWLQKGAYVYVCGGLEMEKGVQQSILEIIETYSANGTNNDEGEGHSTETYFENLRSQGRYLKDVY